MENSVILTEETFFNDIDGRSYKRPLLGNFTIENKIQPSKDNAIVRVIDLSFEPEKVKEMTKEQIEASLGYKIKIV